MAQAKKGDRVKINFTGKLQDGSVFDTTLEEQEDHGDCGCGDDHGDSCGDDCGCGAGPLEITLGEEDFFPQVEEALIGMAAGETKTITIPASEAFGAYDEDMVFTVPRSEVPAELDPQVGHHLELVDEEDEAVAVTVIEINDETITLDANHPLVDEDLTFELELLEIL